MDEGTRALKEKLERLVKEAAEVSVALSRADGTISGPVHFSIVEARAHELGRQFSREVQQRQMGDLVTLRIPKAACPECGTRCELLKKKRGVTSIDGPIEIEEMEGRCPFCRRAFFPRQTDIGF
jgi:uncharacterized protein with PIN domain